MSNVVPRRPGRPELDRDLALAIGTRIRSRRQALGLGMIAFAAIVGVRRWCVHSWESGRSIPYPGHIPPLCRALGIAPNDLFGWEESS